MAGGRRAKSEEELDFNVALGRKIAAARRDKGMTLEELAKGLGVSKQRLHWYEIGRSSVPAHLLKELARALSLSVTELSYPQ